MVSVAGGKLTTHRRIALDALRHLPDTVRPRRLRLQRRSPPRRVLFAPRDLYSCLDDLTVDHLLRLYGSETGKLLAYREEFPNALDRITPGAPDLWAQVYHAIREEWAVTAEDVIHRRTTLGLRGFDTPEIRQKISAFLAPDPGCAPGVRGPSRHAIADRSPTVTARYPWDEELRKA